VQTFRQQVEAKYNIVEVVKTTIKKVTKKVLQTALGLGILSSTALGLDFNQNKTNNLVKTVNKEIADIPGLKFGAKFEGTHSKWKVHMEFKGEDGSTYHIHIVHVETVSGGKFETIKAGGKGDDETVQELGKDMAHLFSEKLKKEGEESVKKLRDENQKTIEDFRRDQENFFK
jgi:hypothetical protein